MSYRLLIVDEKIWDKDLRSIPAQKAASIRNKVLQLKSFPNAGDIKKLANYPVADFRLRIGSYRVLFDMDHESHVILLYRILHRKDSYRM